IYLLEIVDALALLERPEKRGERAEVDRRGAEPDHVGDDPAHLARHHPQHLTARRDLDAHQLLGREREADVVRHRRQIVGAVGERDDLVVVPVLPQLLETGVEIAEMGDHSNYGLAVELDHEPQQDRKSTRLNSSHVSISYAVFCLKKKMALAVAPRTLTHLARGNLFDGSWFDRAIR